MRFGRVQGREEALVAEVQRLWARRCHRQGVGAYIGERQLLPPRGGEHGGETLLGLRRFLDRHHCADFSRNTHGAAVHIFALASASAVASTWCASRSRSSSVVISVCAVVTGMPSAEASAPSARSTT